MKRFVAAFLILGSLFIGVTGCSETTEVKTEKSTTTETPGGTTTTTETTKTEVEKSGENPPPAKQP
jgi:hypothetical protein